MYSFALTENEQIIKKGMASLHQGATAWTGALYLTCDRLVFIGYIMDITRKYMEDIPLEHILKVRPEKTFFVVPNVLAVETIRGKTVKFIVEGRDQWLEAVEDQIKAL